MADRLLPLTGGDFELNVLLEACVLHCRNLIDFFYPTRVLPDDVIAADYAGDWDDRRPPISSTLEKARSRAHKELAHLTTGRKSGFDPAKPWDSRVISAEMKLVISAFIPLADASKLPQGTVAELMTIGNIPTVQPVSLAVFGFPDLRS